MSPGATFERVYAALKTELGSDRFRPGDALEPAQLADRFNSSVTPVRDALHRLVGEGLVAAPRSDGFRVPIVTEVGLRHLYAWNQWLLLKALSERSEASRQTPSAPDVAGIAEGLDTERLFLTIVARTGNSEHLAALTRVNDQLRSIRQVEALLLDDVEGELLDLARLEQDRQGLRHAVIGYHRRRLRAAPQLVAALHAR